MKKTERKGTYSTQWYFDNLNDRFYFKKSPEWAVNAEDFDDQFFLWDDEDESAAYAIQRRYEANVEGRSFFPDRIAGVIVHEGLRLINVPVTRRDLLEREAADNSSTQIAA